MRNQASLEKAIESMKSMRARAVGAQNRDGRVSPITCRRTPTPMGTQIELSVTGSGVLGPRVSYASSRARRLLRKRASSRSQSHAVRSRPVAKRNCMPAHARRRALRYPGSAQRAGIAPERWRVVGRRRPRLRGVARAGSLVGVACNCFGSTRGAGDERLRSHFGSARTEQTIAQKRGNGRPASGGAPPLTPAGRSGAVAGGEIRPEIVAHHPRQTVGRPIFTGKSLGDTSAAKVYTDWGRWRAQLRATNRGQGNVVLTKGIAQCLHLRAQERVVIVRTRLATGLGRSSGDNARTAPSALPGRAMALRSRAGRVRDFTGAKFGLQTQSRHESDRR